MIKLSQLQKNIYKKYHLIFSQFTKMINILRGADKVHPTRVAREGGNISLWHECLTSSPQSH